ncbi:MAG: helix-hairpin-helix domain-containing protein [Thermodesulfobacteriota bacterium]|nr:helix-hairpin-helix domain-containing protein [Thermodesulfobacteriota bacterium]
MSRSERNNNNQGRGDERLLVLLVLGFCILLGDVFSLNSTLFHQPDNQDNMNCVWLAGSQVRDGLYGLTGRDSDHEFFQNYFPEHLSSIKLETDHPTIQADFPSHAAFLFFQPMSVNHADQRLLSSLPGIGPRLSERIIALREKQGSFSRLEELLEVKGIGEKKLEKLKQYCCI